MLGSEFYIKMEDGHGLTGLDTTTQNGIAKGTQALLVGRMKHLRVTVIIYNGMELIVLTLIMEDLFVKFLRIDHMKLA